MLNVLGGACQAGLEKLAPDRTVDARETGKPLPHGGHPALALSCPAELSTPNLNPLGSPTLPSACPKKLGVHCGQFPRYCLLRKKTIRGRNFCKNSLYIEIIESLLYSYLVCHFSPPSPSFLPSLLSSLPSFLFSFFFPTV